MNILKVVLGTWMMLALVSGIGFGQNVGDFRSHQTGAWDSLATWEQYNGSTWVSASTTPDTLHATTVRAGDSVAVTAPAVTYIGSTLIASGGKLAVIGVGDTTVRLRIANGIVTVNGILEQTGGAAASPGPYAIASTATGSLVIAGGGTFQQDQNGGQIPTATWNDGSTFLVTGVTSNTNPGGNSRQSLYNIVWNCPAQSGNSNLGFNPSARTDTSVTIRGDVTVLSTGVSRMYFCGPPAGVDTAHTIVRVTVNGRINVLNGASVSSNGTSAGYTDIFITALGNITVRDSAFLPNNQWGFSTLAISRGSQAGLGTATWYVKSDSVYYGPRTINQNSTDANTGVTSKGKFIFCKPGTQYVYVDSTNQWTGECNMFFGDSVTATVIDAGNSQFLGSACTQRIKHNAKVILGPLGYIGGGTNTNSLPSNFAMDAGATLVIGSQGGIRATDHGSSGAVRVSGNRDYGTASNFEYKGTANQRLGGGFPASANNLTINNSLGVYVDSVAAFTVDGTLAVNQGDLDLNGSTITLGPAASLAETPGNTVTGTSGSITTTRTLASPSSSTDIAGLGIMIGSSADLGSTVITRGHAVQSGSGSGSILRYFDITPTTNTGLNATLVFKYDESELNGIPEANLLLFKSTDNGATWASAGGSVNVTSNTISVSGVNDLSRWTAAGISTVNVSTGLSTGWNMISNPVTNPVPDDSAKHLFPTIISRAFRFSNGYVASDTMHNGVGYWGKFPAAVTNVITGSPRTRDSLTVSSGWNMVGSISNPVDTGTIVSTPPGLRGSNWFGWSGSGYIVVSQLAPGKAFWVKASAGGKFVLANPPLTAPAKKDAPASSVWDRLNTLTITDSKGGSQTLYFGADAQGDIDLSLFDMPPAPPLGVLDARFETVTGGSMVQTHQERVSENLEFPVRIQSDAYPVTVSWTINGGAASYELTDGSGGNVFRPRDMTGGGSVHITNAEVQRVIVRLTSDGSLPAAFALSQNYPNPFNPSTRITYALPVDSRVTVEIYNVLGQRVRTLVNGDVPAGYHHAEWEGTGGNGQQLSSGVYFLQLSARGADGKSFSDVRKLMLLR